MSIVLLTDHLLTVIVDTNYSTRCRIVGNDLSCHKSFYLGLDQSFQRTCTIVDIIALCHNALLGSIGNFQFQLLVFQTFPQLLQQQIYNAEDLGLAQRLVEDDLVQTVQEFRTELQLQARIA